MAMVTAACSRRLRPFLRDDTRGSVAVMTALVLPALIGFGGLAADASMWMSNKSAAQGASDNAARALLTAVNSGASFDQAKQVAFDVAKANGYNSGTGGVSVVVTHPTQSTYTVAVNQAQSLFFSGVNLTVAPTVSGQTSVQAATSLSGTGAACILALDPTDRATLVLSGTPQVNTNNCFVGNNSASGSVTVEDDSGTIISGHALLATVLFTTPGWYDIDGAAALQATTILTAAPATPDPFARLTAPTPGTCQTYGGGSTMTPGTYCGDISVNNSTTLAMAPGTYIINGGDFRLNGQAAMNATGGVTLIFVNGATFHFNGGGALNLTAPTSGAFKGIAIYVDRNTTDRDTDIINGNSNITINGAVYAPTQSISYSGTTTNTACTQLVAYQITFVGNATFGYSASCPNGLPVTPSGIF